MSRSAADIVIAYAEARLEPWGKWSRENGNGLGLPRVSIVHKITKRRLVRGTSRNKTKLTAKGKETLSFRPVTVGTIPEEVAEVDKAVGALPLRFKTVISIEYIDCRTAPLEEKCAAAGVSRPTYIKNLRKAKYRVYVNLGGE